VNRAAAWSAVLSACALGGCGQPAASNAASASAIGPGATSAPAVSLAPELGVSASVTPAQAMAQPWADPLTVPLLNGGSRTLANCGDFFAVSKNVSDAIPGRDEQVLLGQAVRCEALKAVRDGHPAAHSFLAGWTLDDAGWATAPPAFDFQVSPDSGNEIRRDTSQGGSASDFEKVAITPKDAFHFEVAGSGWTAEFTILARGMDVTGDGVEDLIISRNAAVTDGTLRSISYFVVTRLEPTGSLRVVRSFP
jgi:hypothetical protein